MDQASHVLHVLLSPQNTIGAHTFSLGLVVVPYQFVSLPPLHGSVQAYLHVVLCSSMPCQAQAPVPGASCALLQPDGPTAHVARPDSQTQSVMPWTRTIGPPRVRRARPDVASGLDGQRVWASRARHQTFSRPLSLGHRGGSRRGPHLRRPPSGCQAHRCLGHRLPFSPPVAPVPAACRHRSGVSGRNAATRLTCTVHCPGQGLPRRLAMLGRIVQLELPWPGSGDDGDTLERTSQEDLVSRAALKGSESDCRRLAGSHPTRCHAAALLLTRGRKAPSSSLGTGGTESHTCNHRGSCAEALLKGKNNTWRLPAHAEAPAADDRAKTAALLRSSLVAGRKARGNRGFLKASGDACATSTCVQLRCLGRTRTPARCCETLRDKRLSSAGAEVTRWWHCHISCAALLVALCSDDQSTTEASEQRVNKATASE